MIGNESRIRALQELADNANTMDQNSMASSMRQRAPEIDDMYMQNVGQEEDQEELDPEILEYIRRLGASGGM